MKYVLRLCLALLVGAFVVAGCGDDDDDQAAGGGGGGTQAEVKDVQMIIPFPPSIALLGLVIAQEQGYFEDEGINLETKVAEEGSGQVNQLMIAGQEKFGRSGPDLTMIANAEGHDLRMIATFARGIFTIEAPVGSGVESMEDLKGKALGVTDLAGGEIGLVNQALAEAGLEPDKDVELKVVGPGGPAAYRALDSGEIAAYAGATNDFAAMDAQGLDSQSIVPDSLKGLPSNGFVVMQKTLDNEEDRDTAIKIVRAWLKGDQYARLNPDDAFKMACDAVPEECTDEKTAKAFFDRSIEVATPPEGVRPGENAPLDAFETIQHALIQGGDMKQEVDLQEVFPTTYVDQFNEGLEDE
ncbi:MAG TPA: ABC transporter substrate-binding protein [Solirubrobacteraceae bacterium]|nr:ABC transporter substrate-binding protein [Solirubrobacteraceae bacterium]